MRHLWTLLHRWFGLGAATFLFIAGATGAVISWDHELDDLLNPDLMHADSRGPAIPPLELARRIEERDPRARAGYIPLAAEPGGSLPLFVRPRVDPATGRLFELGYNQVFLDPVTGAELGRRAWGQAWPVTRQTAVSFLYALHYSLHIPEMGGIDGWGIWFMGVVALGWAADCFVGACLTLPARRDAGGKHPRTAERRPARGWWARWAPAWKIKTSGSAYRITYDIHRAFGLWFWGLLFILAFTAFSLNLYREVFHPVMSVVSTVTPTPFDLRTPTGRHAPVEPAVGFAEILAQARAEAQRRGWTEPAGAIAYAPGYGIYSVSFFHPGDDHGAAGVGPAVLFYDGGDGRPLGDRRPWAGTAADLFVQAQFPLHSGRILGLPGRILVSAMGAAVAALSVTGVVIWARKRRARRALAARRQAWPAAGVTPHGQG